MRKRTAGNADLHGVFEMVADIGHPTTEMTALMPTEKMLLTLGRLLAAMTFMIPHLQNMIPD